MANHIASANLNVLGGLLQGTMEFTPGLNIISGENGTLKTQLLQALRGGAVVSSEVGVSLRMQTISPKRNSERRATEAILQFFRQNNRTWEANLNERVGAQINGSGFDNYPSLGDLYYLIHEHRCKDGADRRVHMLAVTSEFNEVIQAVFPHYQVKSVWDERLGAPRISMSKNMNVDFPIEALSMGEQEVLSLILSINAGRDNVDVYLIDEPEVHLNWHLEERLFAFLDDLCNRAHKQAIVVTHSRTIFKPRFFPKAQFLRWGEDQRVTWGRDLTSQQRSRLAGDAIEIVALGEFSRPTLFVEDGSHADVVSAIANFMGKSISVSQCGNATNVKSLYQYQLSHGRWANAFFMIDGDNQGNPYPLDKFFVHLPYYCIENLMLDPVTLAQVCSRSIDEVRSVILDAFKAKRKTIFQTNKFFEFLADGLTADHVTFDRLKSFDASLVVADVINALGLSSMQDVLPRYLQAAYVAGRLEDLVPAELRRAISSAEQKETAGIEAQVPTSSGQESDEAPTAA
jgi:predicted ATPase